MGALRGAWPGMGFRGPCGSPGNDHRWESGGLDTPRLWYIDGRTLAASTPMPSKAHTRVLGRPHRTGLVLLIAFLALAGCRGTDRRDEPPVWPRALSYAAGIVPRGLNPLLDRNGWNEVSSVVLSRLFRPDHQGGIAGDLVESYSLSADGRTYRLRLRRNAFWHDGAQFTADDVQSTWERLFDPRTETSLDLNQALLASFYKAGPHEFVFELKAPDTGFLAALTEIAVLPAHRLRAGLNGDDFERNPVGTGPYRFARPAPALDAGEFRLVRHGSYHLGEPAFEQLRIRIIADDDARAQALAAGEADLGHVKPAHVELLTARGRAVYRMGSGAWRGMPLNLARPALADARVRRAVDLAIDREAIVRDVLAGYGQPGYSPVPPASWAFRPAMNRKRYDPAAATRLLDAAGWKRSRQGVRRSASGAPLELEIIVWKDEIFRRRAAELIQQQLGALGIRVKLHRVDGTTYNRLAENMGSTYDTFIGGWGGLLDPGDNLYKKFHSRGSQNRIGYQDAEVDRLLEQARSTLDRERAAVLYEEIVRRVTDSAVFLPLAYPDYLFAARPDLAGIENYILDSWYEFTKYAAEWKPRPR